MKVVHFELSHYAKKPSGKKKRAAFLHGQPGGRRKINKV